MLYCIGTIPHQWSKYIRPIWIGCIGPTLVQYRVVMLSAFCKVSPHRPIYIHHAPNWLLQCAAGVSVGVIKQLKTRPMHCLGCAFLSVIIIYHILPISTYIITPRNSLLWIE